MSRANPHTVARRHSQSSSESPQTKHLTHTCTEATRSQEAESLSQRIPTLKTSGLVDSTLGLPRAKEKRGSGESSAPWGGVQVSNKKAGRPEMVCTLRGKGLTTLTQSNAESQQRIRSHCALGACSCVLGWSLVVLWHDLRSRH